MSEIRLLVLGDSVAWGQGLRPAQRFSTKVAAALGFTPGQTALIAHSGAIIGADGGTALQPGVNGEVPHAFPTIQQQAAAFPSPDTVTHIILNGGINDVDIKTILNLLTSVRSGFGRTS